VCVRVWVVVWSCFGFTSEFGHACKDGLLNISYTKKKKKQDIAYVNTDNVRAFKFNDGSIHSNIKANSIKSVLLNANLSYCQAYL